MNFWIHEFRERWTQQLFLTEVSGVEDDKKHKKTHTNSHFRKDFTGLVCFFSKLAGSSFFRPMLPLISKFSTAKLHLGSPGMVKILRLSRMAKLLRAIPELSIVPRAVFVKKRKSQPGVVVVMAMCADFLKRFLQGFCTSLFLQGLNSWMFKILMDFSVHTLVDYTAPSNFSLTGHNEHFRSGNPQI